MNKFILGENATRQMTLMQLQVRLHKTGEIMYFEAEKQKRSYRLTYLEVSK